MSGFDEDEDMRRAIAMSLQGNELGMDEDDELQRAIALSLGQTSDQSQAITTQANQNISNNSHMPISNALNTINEKSYTWEEFVSFKKPSDRITSPLDEIVPLTNLTDVSLASTMSANDLDSLYSILFIDSTTEDRLRWTQQGLLFNSAIRFGLEQARGGPCGVLATIQARVIGALLYPWFYASIMQQPNNTYSSIPQTIQATGISTVDALRNVSDEARSNALAFSLALSLWLSNRESLYKVVLLGPLKHVQNNLETPLMSADDARLTQAWSDLGAVEVTVSSFVDLVRICKLAFVHRGSFSLLSFVLSMLRTRGLERIASDSDEPGSPLIGMFGHTSQELLNLILSGQARSNLFDGDRHFQDADPSETGFRLKGATYSVDVGLLTDLEALRLTEVGDRLKSPLLPVWVLGSEHHFSVVFTFDPSSCMKSRRTRLNAIILQAFNECDPQNNGMLVGDVTPFVNRLHDLLVNPNLAFSEQERVDISKRLVDCVPGFREEVTELIRSGKISFLNAQEGTIKHAISKVLRTLICDNVLMQRPAIAALLSLLLLGFPGEDQPHIQQSSIIHAAQPQSLFHYDQLLNSAGQVELSSISVEQSDLNVSSCHSGGNMSQTKMENIRLVLATKFGPTICTNTTKLHPL